MPISYRSTRSNTAPVDFSSAVLSGLAPDGGLYLPTELPVFSPAEIAGLAGLEYPTLAERIMAPFLEGVMPKETLRSMLEASYAPFRHTAVAPLKQLSHQHFLLELFHGPTLAFKDFALQFLGRLLDYLLAERGERVTILGATSGDTGSAAIAGCSGREHISIVILHPHGRVSEVQRRQMTTVADANVHNLAVEGTFDDCQTIVKTLFADAAFRQEARLVAVNSINWARLLAQIPYYFYAALALGAPARRVAFSVPTGNFGDIYAGYLARCMGLPMGPLIIASNQNDILTRCVAHGEYAMEEVAPSLSPSMDIQISSNFERLLFNLHGGDSAVIARLMGELGTRGSFVLSPDVLASLRAVFDAHAVGDGATLGTMNRIFHTTGEVIDPHTAVGVAAAEACAPMGMPVVTLATAHPAKFPDAVEQAIGTRPNLPEHLADLFTRSERCTVVENRADAVKDYVSRLRLTNT